MRLLRGKKDGDDDARACTVERCGSCSASRKRAYLEGDVLFARSSPCGCGGEFCIEMIFGEPSDGQKRPS